MEAHSPLSIPLSITPTPSLMGDNQIQDFLIATGPDPASREEVELLSLIHTDPPGSSNLVNTEEPNENTTAISADDNGHLATGTDEAAMPNEMTAPAPSAFRPMFPWLSEGVCLVVAISALTATVVVLANFDKQEQPHWPYADIFNLSALIAILATLLRSMVTLILEALIGQLKWYWYGRARPVAHLQVFDEASHGAWGSSKLLCRIHEADWPFISAIFMVLSIGIGTFTQLALRTMACPKAVPHAVASIPTAHMFFATNFETFPYRNGTDGIETITRMEPTIDEFMKTAIVNGLSGLQSLGAVSSSCDTGNCSFTTYGDITHSTLGIESMCLDVSPFLIQTDNSIITAQWPGSGSTTRVWTNYTFPLGHPSISYLVEGGLGYGSVETGARWFPLFSLDTGGWMHTFSESDYFEDVEISSDLSPHEEYLIRRSFYQKTFMIPTLSPCLERSAYPPTADPLPLINTSSCPQLGMINVSSFPGYSSLAAVQCHLYPSIRQYAGSIVNGQIQETLTGDPIPLNYGSNTTNIEEVTNSYHYAFLDPCIIEGTVYTNANISQAPGDPITIQHGNDSEVLGPKLCFYGASINALWALSDVLDSFAFKQPDSDDDRYDSCQPNFDHTKMSCPSTWWLEPLFNGGNASFDSISAVMSRMADAITNQLRMNGTDWYGNPSNVTGTAFQTVVCTQFQWGWLLFPASVVLASAVLLVATAWKSRSPWGKAQSNRGGLPVPPVWKSSILPLLFYGLEEGARLKGAPVEDKEMVGLAGKMVARLSFEEDELRFHSTKPVHKE